MTDDNPSMGIKTKACINGVYPDTIPTINQNISDIQDDIGNIQDDVGDIENQLEKCVIKEVTPDGVQAEISDGHSIVSNPYEIKITKGDSVIGIFQDEYGDIPYTTPFLPVDGNNNPVEPPSDAIITSSNLDVDPRLVRTTGNQTIRGTKTFENSIVGHDKLSIISSTPVITASKPSVAGEYIQMGFAFDGDPCIQSVNSNGGTGGIYFDYDTEQSQTKVMLGSSYYPVDSNDNPIVPSNNTIMTSGMITVDPRIVHTTGNETIAGNKNFTSLITGRFEKSFMSGSSGFTLLYKRTLSTRTQWIKGFGARTYIIANIRDGYINTFVLSDSQRTYPQPVFYLCTDSNGEVTVWFNNLYSSAMTWYLESNSSYGSESTTGIDYTNVTYTDVISLNVGDATPYNPNATFTSIINSTDFSTIR